MTSAFEIVVIVVAVIGVLGALVALFGSRRTWEGYGEGHLVKDSDLTARRPAMPTASTSAASDERDAEIRQMLQASNARRRRRGQPELDVEAELRRLTHDSAEPTAPGRADEELRAEVRALVLARHRRRARRAAAARPDGEPDRETPPDIEAEVDREIARLTR